MQTPDVFMVEDDPYSVELMQRALKKRSQPLEIYIASDGEQALEVITNLETAPKLIILDLKIPKISGLQLLLQLKPIEKLQTIPMVIFTSSKDPNDITKAYQYGANSYIVKPLDYKEFYTAVNSVIDYWLSLNHSI